MQVRSQIQRLMNIEDYKDEFEVQLEDELKEIHYADVLNHFRLSNYKLKIYDADIDNEFTISVEDSKVAILTAITPLEWHLYIIDGRFLFKNSLKDLSLYSKEPTIKKGDIHISGITYKLSVSSELENLQSFYQTESAHYCVINH